MQQGDLIVKLNGQPVKDSGLFEIASTYCLWALKPSYPLEHKIFYTSIP